MTLAPEETTTITAEEALDRIRAAAEALDNTARVNYAHWIPRAQIMRSLVEGVAVPAICGTLGEVDTHKGDIWDGGGRLPVCPACNLVRHLMFG